MKSPATNAELLEHIAARLGVAGIESPQAESEIILSEVIACARPELIKHHRLVPAFETRRRVEDILRRRIQREPLQYILGYAWFMDIRLAVTPAVLIPRPETELLAEHVARHAPVSGSVLDMGTGSGAIALALAGFRRDLRITASDVSQAALTVAERNRAELGIERVELIQSDLFSCLAGREFNVIAANLPYVAEPEFASLQPEVKEHEPESALVAGADGLSLIRKAIPECASHLLPGGFVIFEIGESQADAVIAMLEKVGSFTDIKPLLDYHRRRRFVVALSRNDNK